MKQDVEMKNKDLEKRRFLIAIIPQKEIVDNLEKIRKIANIKANEKSAPHITLVDNSFEDIKKVETATMSTDIIFPCKKLIFD